MNELTATLKNRNLNQEFKPSFGLRNAHSQTILSSVGFRKIAVAKRFKTYKDKQKPLLLNGGDGVRLEGYLNKAEPSTNKLAILIHGWEGSHDSTYMQSMAMELLENGVDVFRLNLRDHGDTHHLNKEIFNSTLVEEVMNAIEDFQSRFEYAHTHLIGFSLGGNFCLRVAALGRDKQISLSSVIAFCPVIHAAHSNVVLNQAANAVYGRYFVRKWKRSLRKKLEHWPHYGYGDKLDSMKTLDQMNEQLVPKYTSYSNLDDYFEAYAISGDRLAHTIAPCYLFFAADDMIIPVRGISDLADNPDLTITVTERGGHCGYIKNWKWDCWQDEKAIEIVRQHS